MNDTCPYCGAPPRMKLPDSEGMWLWEAENISGTRYVWIMDGHPIAESMVEGKPIGLYPGVWWTKLRPLTEAQLRT